MSKQKIGILGTGDVGQVLGGGFAALGHDVKLAGRDAKNEKAAAWVSKTGAHASAGTFEDAAKFGDVIILATLWTGTKSALDLAGLDHFAGKVVIDATNPLDFSKGAPTLSVGHTDSGGEQVQRWLPKAHVVKAFNIVGNPHMVNPSFPGGKPDMLIAGNDEAAKKTVTELCEALGWAVIDMGGIEKSRYLEPLAMLWIDYFIKYKTGNHAFALLRK